MHFGVFRLEDFGVGIGGDVDGRGEENYGSGKWGGQEEVVPGFFEGFAAADADVEDQDGAAGFSCEHDRAGLGHVARSTRAINREGAIDAFFQAASHDRESAKAAAGRTSLSSAEAKPFDDFASPLTVEGRGVHYDYAVIAVPPDNWNDDAVPEGPDAPFARGVNALGILPAQNFIAQRGAKNANHTEDGGGNEGDLDAAGPGQVGEARVIVRADGFRGCGFGGVLGGIRSYGGCGVGWGHGFCVFLNAPANQGS